MPYLQRPGANLFFDVTGEGPDTIITTHGLTQCGAYWSRTGVSQALAEAGFRVVDLDLRGHGRSTPLFGEDPGYTAEEIANDLGALADHLDVDRFHLLNHATGGMAGLRFAMEHHERLLSLISTDTGSATAPSDKFSDPDYEGPYPSPFETPFDNPAVAELEEFSVREIIRRARQGDGRPFQLGFATNEDPERCWRWLEDIRANGHPSHMADFGRTFFNDLDPKIAGLQKIDCPNFVLIGELDVMFRKPAELLARHLPHVEYQVVPGRGHMLAIEDPRGTAETLLTFLRRL